MKVRKQHAPTTGILAGAALCLTAAALVLLTSALAVRVSGLADDLRRELRFGFRGLEPTPSVAAGIALHNARLAVGTLLCAASRPHLSAPLRPAVDLLLATLLVANAATLGLALGAYGTRVGKAIVLHAPLEFAAGSFAGGAYLQAMTGKSSSLLTLLATAVVCASVLACAAVLETYASVPGPR